MSKIAPPPNQPPPPYGHPQPAFGAPSPMYGTHQTTVVIGGGGGTRVGPDPASMTCPNCNASITTRTKSSPSGLAWMICFGLCFFGCYCCCCIPFCLDSMKDVVHSCPNCNNFVGKYRP